MEPAGNGWEESPHTEPATADPGRRYVTLLFADLSRSTELAAAMEAEHYAALLNALRHAYQAAMTRHGGVVVRVQGDGLLAMFGHPQTREDDGRRAVEAALDLHQQVRALTIELPAGHLLSLHTGIHSGLVLIGAGDIERGRFELLGPVPNIASRLSDAAEAHEILVSEETLGPASRFFSTGAPRALQVKGRDAPILVYRVHAQAPLAARFEASVRHGPAHFVGRRAEFERLERTLDEAMTGPPRSIAVAGAPGMGKTRLIERLLECALQRGWRVLRGYCESDLGAEPLQPFRHMLQTLGEAMPAKGSAGVVALFARLATERPLLLFADDWQWADGASAQVLAALRRFTEGRLFIVLSTRETGPDEVLAAAAQTVTLAPLSDPEAAQVVSDRLPGVDPFVSAEIVRHAGGVPLFIDELCHWVARGDHARGRLHGGAGWLNHLVASRVQHLPAAQAALVRIAAVIGNVVPAWLLERISGEPADGPLLRGLAEQDFLFPGERAGTLRFKHGLTRDIVYDSVGLHERQALHRRIGQALQQHGAGGAHDEALEALAYHFEAGGDAAQAAHYAELAGNKALTASALDRARAQYRAALTALDKLPLDAEVARRWLAILNRLGLVCVFDPSRSELALAQHAVTLAECFGDAASVARARYWLAYINYALGDTPTAIAQGERSLAEATSAGDAALAAQCVAMLGAANTAAANYPRAQELLDRSIAASRQQPSGRRIDASLVFSLVCRACVLGDRGQFAQARECFDEALATIRGATHEIGATTQGWRGAVLLWQGHWAEASDAAADSARIAEATHSLAQLSIARAIGSYAQWMLEQRPESVQAIVEATAWLTPRESGLFHSLNHGWLAEGLTHVGRRQEARQHAALALLRSRQRDLIGVAMCYRALARDAAARSPEAARHYLARAYEVARQRDSAHETAVTRLCEAQIAVLHEEPSRAVALLDAAMPAFEAMAMDWHLAEAARLRRLISSRAA